MRVLLLSLIVLFGVGFAYADSPDKLKVEASTDTTEVVEQSEQIVIYYFFQTKRCPSCKKIEAYTDEAVTTKFAKQLESEEFSWQPINVDLDGNDHYFEDYELFTKSVIVSRVIDGKETEWKNLSKIWELLNDKDEFIGYLESEIKTFSGIK